MRKYQLVAAGFALSPSLASAFSNPNAPLQGCLDLDCPTTEDSNAAVCDMGVGVADATIIEGILPVPRSDEKLSVALTRSPGYLMGTKGLLDLAYNYTLWTIQPPDFNLTTGNSGSDEDLPEVCGFIFRYIFGGFPPKTNGYNLVGDDGIVSESYGPKDMRDSTECQASGVSNMCMQSIEEHLVRIDVNNGTKRGDAARCEAIAEELEDSVGYRGNCGQTLEGTGISITGVMLLGPGAPDSDNESPVRSGDDGFCFPKQEASDMFLRMTTFSVLNIAPEDDNGEDFIPDVPPKDVSAGYLPLMTAELDGEGKVAGNATFMCLRTLDQVYWAENLGAALRPDAWWKAAAGLCLVVMMSAW